MQKEALSLPEQRRETKVNFYRHLERKTGAEPVFIVPPLGNIGSAIEYLTSKLDLLTITQLKNAQLKKQGKSADLIPAVVTNRTIAKGIAPSPEGICFPFKIGFGYMLERLDEFNEIKSRTDGKFYPLILTHQSSGYCREREYGDLALRIFDDFPKDSPYKNFDFYNVHESTQGIVELISELANLSGKSWLKVTTLISETIERLNIIDEYENKIRFTQSLLKNINEAEPFLTKARELTAQNELTNEELKKAFRESSNKLDELDKAREKPKGIIAITGEIFHCEEFMNNSSHNLGRILLKHGFYFEKKVGIHEYTSRFKLNKRILESLNKKINPWKKDKIREAAKRGGLINDMGGHSVDVVALSQMQSEERTYDGIILIGPFGCEPIIASSDIVRKITQKSQMPYLEIKIDQQGGQAGLETRIEAFLDLIERKHNKEQGQEAISPQGEIFQR